MCHYFQKWSFGEKAKICHHFVSHRVFVNRSLAMEKIKCFGFDMDYTLAGQYVVQQQLTIRAERKHGFNHFMANTCLKVFDLLSERVGDMSKSSAARRGNKTQPEPLLL